jgi:hypothetical protein
MRLWLAVEFDMASQGGQHRVDIESMRVSGYECARFQTFWRLGRGVFDDDPSSPCRQPQVTVN